MTGYQIGRVTAVTGDRVIVSLLDYEARDDGDIGVPENMSIDVVVGDAGPEPILIGQPGTFVEIQIPNGRLLAMVIDVAMKEVASTAAEQREAEQEGQQLVERPSRSLSAIAVGTLDRNDGFERGADVLPTVNAPVFAVLPKTINTIYSSYAEGDFSIGDLSLLPGQKAKINMDAFFSRHAAVLGQTGGGKSWTVASFTQKIAKFPQATLVIFDLHGEYQECFGDDVDYISAAELELPYWLMNSEELLGLMVDRSEQNAPNQIAKFKELLQAAKETHPENQLLGIPKITIDTPVYFDFDAILSEFRRLDTERIPGEKKDSTKQGPLFGQFYRLLMRTDSKLNDKRYDLIFRPKTYTTSASMEDLFRRILGEKITGRRKVVVLDMSQVPFDVRNSIIALLMRCLFDFSYWHRRVFKETHPVAVFCDEAHVYLNEHDLNSTPARVSAERIAKEGRKYGISLTVISQRPREVSATILSQCNSFLCLRITNPDDQAYVRSLLPDSIRGIVNMFAILRRGECILMGDSVLMPTRIKLDPPDPAPKSDDTSFYKKWNQQPEDLAVARVLDAWRKQEVQQVQEGQI